MGTGRMAGSARDVNVPVLRRLALLSGLALVVVTGALVLALRRDDVGPGAWVVPVGLLGLVAALLLVGALTGLRRPARTSLPELTPEEAAARLPDALVRAGVLGIISSGLQLALSLFGDGASSAWWWYLLVVAVLALSVWMVLTGSRQQQSLPVVGSRRTDLRHRL